MFLTWVKPSGNCLSLPDWPHLDILTSRFINFVPKIMILSLLMENKAFLIPLITFISQSISALFRWQVGPAFGGYIQLCSGSKSGSVQWYLLMMLQKPCAAPGIKPGLAVYKASSPTLILSLILFLKLFLVDTSYLLLKTGLSLVRELAWVKQGGPEWTPSLTQHTLSCLRMLVTSILCCCWMFSPSVRYFLRRNEGSSPCLCRTQSPLLWDD